jgi:hypothetical protein
MPKSHTLAPARERVYRPVQGYAAWHAELERLAAVGIPARGPAPDQGHRPRVVIPMLVGMSELFAVREGLIAHALRLRGSDPLFVLCDGLDACDARTFDRDSEAMCRGCLQQGEELLGILGLQVTRLSDWIDPPERARLTRVAAETPADRVLSAHHAGVPLAPFVFGSTLRYARAGRLRLGDRETLAIARRNLATAMIATEAARRLISTLRPDRIFSSHGIYATWGPWAGVARAVEIPCTIYGGGWRADTLITQRGSFRRLHCDDIWPRWRDLPLSDDEQQELDEYLATREDNRADFTRYFERVDRDRWAFLARHGLAGRTFRRTLAAFTNVAFDAAELEPRGAFVDMFEWLEHLVDWAARHPELLLLIKAHPAESRFIEPTPEEWRIGTWLERRCAPFPPNVRLIPPDDPISTYTLYSMIDAGLVNTSTVGLEMALEGKVVFTTGAGVHYEKPGIVHAPTTRSAYFAALDRFLTGAPDPQQPSGPTPDQEVARRYAYTMYFRKSIPFEPIRVATWAPVASCIEALTDLSPGTFPGLDTLCAEILAP